jgi:hypothetical protein
MNPVIAATVIMASIFALSKCDDRKDAEPVKTTVRVPLNYTECIAAGGMWGGGGKFSSSYCRVYQK